ATTAAVAPRSVLPASRASRESASSVKGNPAPSPRNALPTPATSSIKTSTATGTAQAQPPAFAGPSPRSDTPSRTGLLRQRDPDRNGETDSPRCGFPDKQRRRHVRDHL